MSYVILQVVDFDSIKDITGNKCSLCNILLVASNFQLIESSLSS